MHICTHMILRRLFTVRRDRPLLDVCECISLTLDDGRARLTAGNEFDDVSIVRLIYERNNFIVQWHERNRYSSCK